MDTVLDTVFNGLLMASSGYAMYKIKPINYPLAFSACAVGVCHGCVGVYTRFFDRSCDNSEGKCLNSAKRLTNSCMEFLIVPLINMDLYKNSQKSNSIALGHGIFSVPLAFESILNFLDMERDKEAQSLLKHLTALGNILSLVFFAANESNTAAGAIAFSAFFAYCGVATKMDQYLKGTEEKLSLTCYSILFALLPSAISAGSEASS